MRKRVLFLWICLTLCAVRIALAQQTQGDDRTVIEQIAAVYDAYGEYGSWPLEGFRKAEQLLCDSGILPRAELTASDTRSSWEISQALLERLPGVSSHLIKRVAVSLWGDEELWTMENACWYTQTLNAHGLQKTSTKIYMLPGDGVVSAQEAVQTAQSHVKQRYNVDLLARADVDAAYTYFAPSASQAPRWRVVFAVRDTRERLFEVQVSDSGDVMDSSMFQESDESSPWAGFTGRIFELSLEEQAEYARQFTTPMYGLPDSTHIQAETARKLAAQALAGEGIAWDGGQAGVYLSFVISGAEELPYPYWAVYYMDAETGRELYRVLLSATDGEVLKIETQDWSVPRIG